MSAIFPLRWDAVCEACDQIMKRGEDARYNEDDEIIHAGCRDVEAGSKGPICPGCNLLLPLSGVCGTC